MSEKEELKRTRFLCELLANKLKSQCDNIKSLGIIPMPECTGALMRPEVMQILNKDESWIA